MKKLLLLCSLLAVVVPAAYFAQYVTPGQGVAGMNADKVVEIDLLTQTEVADKIKNGWTSVLAPTGGTEIRGPHAINGVHTILAHQRAVESAKRLGKTLVAPTLPFAVSATGGYNNNSWQKFMADGTTAGVDAGAIQVSSETFKGVQQGVVESLAYMGFKDIFLMGDHGGGQNEMRQVSEEMNAKLASRGVKVYYIPDFYQKTHDDIDAYMYSHRLPIAGHGGMMETAEMMYWEPSPSAYIRPNYKTVPYTGNSDDIDGWKKMKDAQASGQRGARGGGRGAPPQPTAAGTIYPTGNPHPSTKAIGKDLAEIGINNTVTQAKKLLAEHKSSNQD